MSPGRRGHQNRMGNHLVNQFKSVSLGKCESDFDTYIIQRVSPAQKVETMGVLIGTYLILVQSYEACHCTKKLVVDPSNLPKLSHTITEARLAFVVLTRL